MKHLIALVLLLGFGPLQAATLLYQYNGVLLSELEDIYGLDGATITYSFFVDEDAWYAKTGNAVWGNVKFSERPDNGSAVVLQLLDPSISAALVDGCGNFYCYGFYDFSGGFEQGGELDGLVWTGAWAGDVGVPAADGCYPNAPEECGYYELPSYEDAEWGLFDGLKDDRTNGLVQTYELTITDYSVSVIPIPAAVWLFASGLLGLGWLRRVRA